MSKNQFDLLCDHDLTLVEDLKKHQKISSSKSKQSTQATLLFGSEQLKKNRSSSHHLKIKEAPFQDLYDIEYLWFVILEFLPIRDLLNCALCDKYTSELVHSYNCYSEILKRDFLNMSKGTTSNTAKQIIKNQDNSGVFVYLLRDVIGMTKSTSQRVEQIKKTIAQPLDDRTKKIFRKVFLALNEEFEGQNQESEMLRQHVRAFLIEKLRILTLEGMKTKVRECLHNHCDITSIDNMDPYTYRLKCLDCELTAHTNFNPSDIYKNYTLVKWRRCSSSQTMGQKYVLRSHLSHVYEFVTSTIRQ